MQSFLIEKLADLLFTIAYADSTVAPSPAPGIDTTNPVDTIISTYKFATYAAGALAFVMIVIASIKYAMSLGNPSAAKDAIDQIGQAALGIFLLFGAALILRTISPGLTDLKLPTLAPVNTSVQQATSTTGGSGGGNPFPGGGRPGPGGSCSPAPAGNPCSVENMRAACANWDAVKASRICNFESGGGVTDIPSGVDRCRPGGEVVSWGLMQINLSVSVIGGVDCSRAFDRAYTGSNKNCRVVNQALYQQCVNLAKNPTHNLKAACDKYQNGGFRHWSFTVGRCGI